VIKKFLFFFFLIFLLFSLNCTKTVSEKRQAEAALSAQKTEGSPETEPSRERSKTQGHDVRVENQEFGTDRSGTTSGKPWGKINMISLSDEEKKAIEIETVIASYKPMTSQLQAMGKVLAHQFRKAIVSYAFPARISEIHVKIGDWVKPGQELVTLQSEEVGKAKSEYYKAIADCELTQSSYEREKKLFDRGVGAQKNLLTSEAELKVSQANLNAAEKKLHVLGFTEAEVKEIAETHQINPTITLFAPISGKVIQNNAVLGGMIDQSTEILTIMDPGLLWIDADIYERDISKIRIGQSVDVAVPAYPSETFSGKTSYISDVLKEETRTITVRTEVENKGYKLKPGMFANIKISLNHESQALALPEEAVLDDKDNKIVFIKRDGNYYPQLVETGTKDDGYVEILKGIRAGDEIVTKGNYQLKSKLYDEILKKAGIHG
jgi:cobalt-zinc-cadmium efflux system membrane fusion protein